MFFKRMIKWTLIGALGAGATGVFLFGDSAGSYLHTAAKSIRDGVGDQIPIEFELKRAESLIEEIEPQIEDGKRQVARAEVELAALEDDVERLSRSVQRGEAKLRTVSKAASTDGGGVAVAQLASLDGYRVELDLERTFDTYKNNRALLEGKRALIQRQAKAVTAARLHLDTVRAEKARVEDTIATLKTQKQQLDALAASATDIELDDTALGRAKDVLATIKKRLDVRQRLIEDDLAFERREFRASHTAPDGTRRSVVTEIRNYFAEECETSEAASPLTIRTR